MGMRRITIMSLALIAVLATSALLAGTASAKPLKLDLTYYSEEFQVRTGQELIMGGSEVTVATSIGIVTCTEGEWGGVDQTNNEKTDKIEIRSGYGHYPCSNTTSFPGEATVTGYLHGILSLGSNGKAELNAKGLEIELEFSGENRCRYTFTKLKGTVTATPSAAALEMKFSKQKLKLEAAKSVAGCPKKATLTLSSSRVFALFNGNYYSAYEHTHP
jgi:hypothetical protein